MICRPRRSRPQNRAFIPNQTLALLLSNRRGAFRTNYRDQYAENPAVGGGFLLFELGDLLCPVTGTIL
jgi:hypothetical protein